MKIKKPIIEEEINTTENLELSQNTTFKKSIKCKSIICIGERWNIDALNINARNIDASDIDARNINARNINARNIDASDIDALNIDARNIDAWNIDARNINANIIICEKRVKKEKSNKTITKVYIENKSKLKREEKLLSEEEGGK